MADETQQITPEPAQPEPISTPPAETPISEPLPAPVSPQEPMESVPSQPETFGSTEIPPEATVTTPSPESAIPVNNDIPANEPLESAPVPENVPIPDNPNITVEKHGNDVTITEVMEPTAPDVAEAMPDKHSEPATAQMAGNEPLDLTEEIKTKQRQENLKLANEKRQSKKREKVNDILNLFAERQTVTNDEVEKLLHVSDATATRYLETLEKEGKIKQVGKTGKGVSYIKI
ncbi:MAG: helix-turn-helix domain-containing protein [Candidatus Paceibacterota bacterium]|jgi:hypothetical protein